MTFEDYAEKYTCASCAYYKFEGQGEKARCTKFSEWYWPNDKCDKYWTEAGDWYRDKRPVQK